MVDRDLLVHKAHMSWLNSFFPWKKPSPPPPTPELPERRILDIEPNGPDKVSDSLSSPDLALQTPVPDRRRNKVIFAAGTVFFAFSVLVTRRSLARRRFAANAIQLSKPNQLGQPASVPEPKVNGAFEALEALNLATINVLSLGMVATGATLWYLDINNLGEARKALRGGLGVDGSGKTEQEANEEIEEWVATVLSRKEQKEHARTMANKANETGKER